MGLKPLLAVLAGFLILTLGGSLIYGVLLMDFAQEHTLHYEGLMNTPPSMVGMVIGNVLYALLLVVVLYWAQVKTATKGLVYGAILFLLMSSAFDFSFHAFMNLFDPIFLVVDVVAYVILGALMGAATGAILGKAS